MFSDSMMLGGGRKAAFSIANSVRLDGVADYFTRTPAVVGNSQVWTYSGWLKVGVESGGLFLLTAGDFSGGQTGAVDKIWINDSPTEKWLEVASFPGGASGYDWRVRTSALFRDPTAWYHVVVALDTHSAAAEERVKIWINGQLQTNLALADYPDQHKATLINSTQFPHYINKYCQLDVALYTAAGYFADTILVDGAALDPSHFGETDPVTGSWRPKRYVGQVATYGGDITQPGMSVTGTFNHALNCGPITALIDNTTQPAADNAGHTASSHFVIDLGGGNAQPVRRALLTNHTSTGINVAGITWGCWFSDDNATFTLAASMLMETGLGTVNRFDIPDVGAHRYWKFGYLSGAVSGDCWLQEVSLHTATAIGFGTNGFHLDFADAADLGKDGSGNTTLSIATPAMTGYSSPFGTVTTNSDVGGGYEAWRVFNQEAGATYYWSTAIDWPVPAYVTYDWSGQSRRVIEYAVIASGDNLNRNPKDWTLEGWNGSAWVVVDTVTGQAGWSSVGERRTFTVTNPGDYTKYKFNCSANNGGARLSVGEIELKAVGNHWLPVSLGAADVVADTPTNNYAVWNVVEPGRAIFSNGSLAVTSNSPDYWHAVGSMGVSSGKWYFEVTPIAGSGWRVVGVSSTQVASTSPPFNGAGNYGYVSHLGSTRNNGVTSAYGDSYASGDVIGVALDLDSGKLWFAKNNTWQASGDPVAGVNAAFTGLAGTFFPCLGDDASGGVQAFLANFGQIPFASSPPVGFKSLCTANLPKPVIQAPAKHMDVVTYSGNGTARAISGLDFQPDLVWVKSRSNGNSGHTLFDVIRGPGKILSSSWSGAELTEYPDTLISFNPDGFGLGVDVAAGTINVTGQTYVAWCWKAGGAAAANTTGSIPSTVSANPTAGFSIATYTGTGSAATVGHGLGTTPALVIAKDRSNAVSWRVYHSSVGATKELYLDLTNAATTSATAWNDTSPTSSVFSLGAGAGAANESGHTYVAYCWAEVPGFSKFGAFTGNGSSDGAFVHCGFRPRLVLAKRTDATGSWRIVDTARDPYNEVVKSLYPNSIGAEDPSDGFADFTATGFKIRRAVYTGTYIYAAFAEAPLGGAKTVPAKAR